MRLGSRFSTYIPRLQQRAETVGSRYRPTQRVKIESESPEADRQLGYFLSSIRCTNGDVSVLERDPQQEVTETDAARDKNHEEIELKYKGKTALVVGAGPGGMMASAYLAKHGFQVKVRERRSDPAKNPYPSKRANLIRLRPSAVKAMRDVGIKLPINGFRHGMQKLRGVNESGESGTTTHVEVERPSSLPERYCGERSDIAAIMLEDIPSVYAANIDVLFDCTCQGVDFKQKRVTFKDPDDVEFVEEYDLLVAADGTNSFVRQELQKEDKALTVRSFPARRGYKLIRNMSVSDEDGEVAKYLTDGCSTTLFTMDNTRFADPPRTAGFLLYKTGPDLLNLNINHTQEAFARIEGHEEEWLQEILPETFPKVWKQEAIERMATVPFTLSSTIKKVSKLHSQRTVLVGDAGHSSSPSHGWGCNLAILDGPCLGEALRIADGNVDIVAETFHSLRSREVHNALNMLLSFPNVTTQISGVERLLPLLGKVHKWMHSVRKRIAPHSVLDTALNRYNDEQISAVAAMNVLKRDALILFSLILLGLIFAVVGLVSALGLVASTPPPL